MIDTHCHIHDSEFDINAKQALFDAREAGVETVVCVGTNTLSSREAVVFARENNVFAAVAQHPHDAKDFTDHDKEELQKLLSEDVVVAIGECGLDYYYEHSPKQAQEAMLRWHLSQAHATNLPVLFHVRDAFADFWRIFDEYHEKKPLRGLIHSFTAGVDDMHSAVERGLYVAFNGIHTFTKEQDQLEVVKAAPIERIVLETDAPFLTPVPFRGKVNEPKYVAEVAKFIAKLRGEPLEEIQLQTTRNAKELLRL